MTLNEIILRLEKVEKCGSGYKALCPSHDDQRRSLSLRESDGKILLKCFAGCDTQTIISALSLDMKDLFVNSNDFRFKNQPKAQTKRIAETYDYTDENGELLFQAVRYEPKDFCQRRPDGNGGWAWNLQNTRLVLYHLPEVMASPLVYLAEGEKDVETLRKNDLPATCAPMGAGKWRTDYNEFLQGKTVVILPDNDEPGRKHAAQIAKALHGIVTETVIVELPDLPPKGDVTDYFQNGGTVDELIGLIERADAWQPNGEKNEIDKENVVKDTKNFPSLFTIQDASVWLENAKLRPVPKSIFGELWFEGELCILFADTGKGKSILAVQIGNSISKGLNIANFTLETLKQKVLYFDFELSDKQFEARYSTRQGDFFTNHYAFDENFKRGEINQNSYVPKHFKDFQEYLNYSLEFEIVETGAKVLIVDNITYLKNATETAKDALPLMKELIRLKKKHNLSIMALAHTPKRDLSKPLTVNDLQGSKMLSNFADSIYAIGESAKDKNLRYLKQIKARNTEIIYDTENVATCQVTKPNNFLMFEFLNLGSEREHLKVLTDTDKTNLIQQVKNLSAMGKSQRAIAKELGIPLTSVNRYSKK